MIDDIRGELARCGLGLDARDELPAGRPHHLHLHEREALVEGLDDLLLHLREVGGVVDDAAFLLGGLDQLGRPERVFLLRRGRAGRHRGRKAKRARNHGAPRDPCVVHAVLPVILFRRL